MEKLSVMCIAGCKGTGDYFKKYVERTKPKNNPTAADFKDYLATEIEKVK